MPELGDIIGHGSGGTHARMYARTCMLLVLVLLRGLNLKSLKSWESSRMGVGGGEGRRRDLACRRCGSSQADAAEAVWRSAGAAGGVEAPGSANLRQCNRRGTGQYRKVLLLYLHNKGGCSVVCIAKL